MKKGCCENTNTTIKIASAEKINCVSPPFFVAELIIAEPSFFSQTVSTTEKEEKKTIPRYFPPPNSSYPSIFIKDCLFLI